MRTDLSVVATAAVALLVCGCGGSGPSSAATSSARPAQATGSAQATGALAFSRCMRSHGVQNWPDPYVDRSRPGDPRPVFDLHSAIDPNAPRILADLTACQHLMPQSTTPYFCSRILAQHIPGSPPGAEACGGGSPEVP